MLAPEDLLVLIGAALVVAAAAWALRAAGRPRRVASPFGLAEDEAAYLLVDRGSVVHATSAATRLLATAPGEPVAEALTKLFGTNAGPVAAALGAAESSGQTWRGLHRTEMGRPFEVRLFPMGGRICLSLFDASAIEAEIGEAVPVSGTCPASGPQAEAPATDPDLVRGEPAHPRPGSGVAGLLEQGALILWRSDADGRVLWSGGSLRLPEGTVRAQEVIELLATRRLTLGETGRPTARSEGCRLEVVRGASVLPLTVVEVDTPDGERMGYAVDASAMASAERTLTRFVQTMTETFAHLTVGLAIFDKNRSLALFNPALLKTWQQDPAWLARRPGLREILDRLRSARRLPEVKDYHAFRDRLLGLFDDTERAEYEELWNLTDGTTLRVLARPHPHGSLAFIFDDVTERMQLERANRHMDDLINSTLEHLDEGLAVFAPDGTLQFVNAAFHEIWNTDSELVSLAMHASDLCALCSRLTVETEVWDRMVTYATGEQNRHAWSARLSLGSGRMLAARFAPLPDGSTMALFSDVTDSERIAAALQERNEALEAAEQMRSAVLDQISHRLRTPLNTIFGFGELLANARQGPLSPLQQHYVSGILEAAAQLLDTIGAVTELASLQIDPLDGEDTDSSVEEILMTTMSLLEKRAADTEVALRVELGGAVGILACNPVRLRQIVFNLTSDAIHRCPRGGEVVLCAERDADGTVEIKTSETAAPELLSELPAMNGLELASLTLSLVRRLVAQEGGVLEISVCQTDRRIAVSCRFPEQIEALPAAHGAG